MDNIWSSTARVFKTEKEEGGLVQQYTNNIFIVKVADFFSFCNICWRLCPCCKSSISLQFLCELMNQTTAIVLHHKIVLKNLKKEINSVITVSAFSINCMVLGHNNVFQVSSTAWKLCFAAAGKTSPWKSSWLKGSVMNDREQKNEVDKVSKTPQPITWWKTNFDVAHFLDY